MKFKKEIILFTILLGIALTSGIISNDSSGKYVKDNFNSKNNVISELKDAPCDWDPQITRAVGPDPWSVFIGDVNNDGYNDIATANWISDTVSILLWNSTSGDWNPQITRAVEPGPSSIFIGDANNDGYNDIATANWGSDSISILLWNSVLGDWDPQITRAIGGSPYSIFIGDANNDGYNDIATANWYSDSVSILLWNSTSGDWDPQITRAIGHHSLSLFIGDANNDGYNDIAAANEDSDNVSILLWNSTSGDWDPQITRAVGGSPHSIFIGDANNDGYNDIATANFDHTVSILLWNSVSGDWDSKITRAVGDGPYSIFIGDANNDGYNEIATANRDSDTVSILLWNSTLSDWNPQITRSVGNCPLGVFIGDANNDGYNDITTANADSDTVSILLWNYRYISIISPESKVYGPLKGYYPATYGFENDKDGAFPEGFIDQIMAGCDITVISELDGHKKILDFDDPVDNAHAAMRYNLTTAQTFGTMEFWIRTTDVNKPFSMELQNSTYYKLTGFQIDDSAWRVSLPDLAWTPIPELGTPLNNYWHHVRIDFECTNGGYEGLPQYHLRFTIDNTSSTVKQFLSNCSQLEAFYYWTSISNVGYHGYLDAMGYSWDPAYEVGDNLQEGLLLSFENNTVLDWIAYSLDGHDNKTITEQEIIPLPEDGTHSIQLFSRDAESERIIKSEIRYFSVDTTSPKIIIHSPIAGEYFGFTAPKYNISLIEANLESIWYTIDGGITNFTINQLSGFVDQHTWYHAPIGSITIGFYAKDILNHTAYEEVVVTKIKPSEGGGDGKAKKAEEPAIPVITLIAIGVAFTVGISAIAIVLLRKRIFPERKMENN